MSYKKSGRLPLQNVVLIPVIRLSHEVYIGILPCSAHDFKYHSTCRSETLLLIDTGGEQVLHIVPFFDTKFEHKGVIHTLVPPPHSLHLSLVLP